MTESIGKTIRRLRKERGFTQEELAERLNVTSQAVSKWESESGMPDISQIVPLACVFGVSTDVLFGLDTTTEMSEARAIVERALAKEKYGQRETYLEAYDELAEGLKRYPTNPVLLNHYVWVGTSLALPGDWLYAPERSERITDETIRASKLLIECSSNMTDIMTARQNLVFLYLAQGKYEQAAAEARKFPARNGFTVYSFLAEIHSAMGHPENAITCLCSDLSLTLQVLEDDTARLGKAYCQSGQYAEAITVYETFFAIMKAIFGDSCPPPYHDFDSGDLYLLLACACLAVGDEEKAMDSYENAIAYYARLLQNGNQNGDTVPWKLLMTSPLLKNAEETPRIPVGILQKKLSDKLQSPELAALRDHPRYPKLARLVHELIP